MRIFNILLLSLIIGLTACSSTEKKGGETTNTTDTSGDTKENRVSPAETATATIGENTITVNYGSPRVKGRAIYGELVPYNEVWRTGANEATTITFTQDVMINGQLLKKDTYAFFAIPSATEWALIFNLDAKQWGAFKYSEAEDALRITATPTSLNEVVENLAFTVTPNSVNDGGTVSLAWEKIKVEFSFTNIPAK